MGHDYNKHKLVMIIPRCYGETGDAVNERQLSSFLSKYFEHTYVITLVRFDESLRKLRKSSYLGKNVKIIEIIRPPYPPVFHLPVMLMYGLLIRLLLSLMKALGNIAFLYVRDPVLCATLLAIKKPNMPIIVKVHRLQQDEIRTQSSNRIVKKLLTKIGEVIEKYVLLKTDLVACPSESFKNILIKRYDYPRDKIVVVPAGVNLNLIEKVKRQINGSPLKNTLDVGFLGSLSWWQGVDILVRAIALLREKTPNLRLIIIGDGELRRPIEELCKSLDIPYEITGFIPHEEALKRLGMLDVMVLPRRKTPTTESVIPIKVVEAWALGVPVIVTKHQVFLDYQIRDYEDVIYCEPDPNSVANAIRTLLTNDELRKKLETNGPKLARQFDYDKIAERILRA